MVFSDTTNKDGIIQQIEFRTNLGDTGISGNATLLKQITGQVNDWYMKATKIIITADGRWQWDDTNWGNQPIATTDLVDGQRDYTVLNADPGAGQDWLQVERVEMKDTSGNWVKLAPVDLRDFGASVGEEFKTDATPIYYDFNGSSIKLYPSSNYDSTGGLKVWFSRSPKEFRYTDTDARPGFTSIFHEYLVLGATYNWEKYKKVGNAEQTKRDIQEMESNMAGFYGNRAQYEVNKLARRPKSFK